ncbi:DNA methyltransferase [Tateyamaria sp. ANG-S1]|uniref:DNA methyltransferase n=1 Tax=Tateyamaria sp. ANG-S1 TaxID=1577905 RepID=UPI00057C37A5|nr:DNA methyltransferase [Tateyamaria sp. ANG-S1]KIC51448.1 DNA methyltransferase [Tateyamaria sp. ANG-S1]
MTQHNIINGEALETLKGIEAGTIDLVVTDPPYLCNYQDRDGRKVRNDDNAAGVLGVFSELFRVLQQDSYAVVFCGWTAIDQFSKAWADAGFKVGGHLVWGKDYVSNTKHVQYRHESAWLLTKGNPQRQGKALPDLLDWTYSGNRHHPTQKAVEVIAPLIRSFSKPGDVVLDPFLGSGTTAVAAALSGRVAIGVELEAKYCELAKNRVSGAERYHAAKGERQAA